MPTRSAFQQLGGFVRRRPARYDDDRDGRVDHTNLLEQLESVEPLHLRVEHDEVGASLLQGRHGFGRFRGGLHLVGSTVLEPLEERREGA